MSDAVDDDEVFTRKVVSGICGALGGTGARTSLGTSMERNHSTNVLLAVMLNGFARRAEGRPLSDLESAFADAFARAGFSDAELGEMGRSFSGASQEVRSRFFPERFAALGAEDSYGRAELRADLPQLGRDILATCKNIWPVDASRPVGSLGNDAGVLEGQEELVSPGPSADYLREAREKGWGLVCMGLPADHPALAAARSSSAGPYWMSLSYAKCHEESSGEVGKDEPRFSLALCDGSTKRDYTTEELSMGTGYTRAFEPNRLWTGAVDNGGLATVIDAWEMDTGPGFEKAKIIVDAVLDILMAELTMDSWADLVFTFAGEVGGAGLPPQVVALFAMILTAVREFLQNNDDHVGTYSLLVPEPVLVLQKQIQDTLRNPPPEGAVRKIAQLTGASEPSVTTLMATGHYRAYRPVLRYDAGSDGEWEVGFLLLPDSSSQVTGLPARVRLESVLSGKFATVDPYDDNGPSIRQQPWGGEPNQRWDLHSLPGNLYRFSSAFSSSGRGMSIEGPYPGNAPKMRLWSWRNESHQKWRLLPVAQNEYFITSHYRGGAISVQAAYTADGVSLEHHSLQGDQRQVWRILGA
ncbi:RICIN domain-containing protein [Streptomyces sp. NPDC057235]|uniref:RICIN domain-containing protein n=1 Tax=Streptomyces sp. NPDC057235 TaxID=3346058 RepID=UPI00362E5498